MELDPFDDWCVIEPEEFKTDSGIIIPDGVEMDPSLMSKTGKVLAVGPGPLLDSGERGGSSSRPGDRVEFLTAIAKEVKLNGKKCFVVRDRNVMMRYI